MKCTSLVKAVAVWLQHTMFLICSTISTIQRRCSYKNSCKLPGNQKKSTKYLNTVTGITYCLPEDDS